MSLELGESCPECGDTGEHDYFQCPAAILKQQSPWERTSTDIAIRAYIQYDTRGVLPVLGGYVQQSSFFGTLVDLIDSERGRYEELLADKTERDRKADAARAARAQSGSQGGVHRPFN